LVLLQIKIFTAKVAKNGRKERTDCLPEAPWWPPASRKPPPAGWPVGNRILRPGSESFPKVAAPYGSPL